MKIYLILKYNQDGPNTWADVWAYTSPRERDDAFYALKGEHPTWDVETQDITVTKRPYKKAQPEAPSV